jgi:myo-inositol-1(or 4)-monophosphatase
LGKHGIDDDRLHFARALAERAGKLGTEFFRKLDSLTIESKGYQDMVPEADREVELFVRREIAMAYPEDGIIGEEHPPAKGSTGCTWVIDPIDGTANFVKGIPAWCVVIACAKDGVTEIGVIHEPSTGETFYGQKGGGAFLNGKAIKASTSKSLGDGSLGVGFSNRRETANVPGLIADLLGRGGIFFCNASGALMLAYVQQCVSSQPYRGVIRSGHSFSCSHWSAISTAAVLLPNLYAILARAIGSDAWAVNTLCVGVCRDTGRRR